jgi:hypothetical protein
MRRWAQLERTVPPDRDADAQRKLKLDKAQLRCTPALARIPPGFGMSGRALGYSCLAEQRMVETIRQGRPATPFLKFGDRVRIEMLDAQSRSIFGAIDQEVVRYQRVKT